MNVSNQNIPLVHRKEWQFMTPLPTPVIAGSFIVTDVKEKDNYALLMINATIHYLYNFNEDSWAQITSGALAGTFGTGSCGTKTRFSQTITANGGSTTTVTTTTNINNLCIGEKIRFLSGSNIGKESTITGILLNQGGTHIIQFNALQSPVVTNDTFVITTGRYFILNAGTQANGSFKVYDPLLGTWNSLAFANLPAAIAADSKLVCSTSDDIFASGTATGGSTTTIVNNAKNWTTNQWTNYQVRITAGTGIGQISTIISNTATTLTIAAGATIDSTSVYEITANDDNIYFLGNASATMYKYSISSNTWKVMSPTTARGGVPGTGLSANICYKSGDPNLGNENDIRDGRYIYSFRGGASNLIDRFDIAGGTAGAGAWTTLTPIGNAETFTTGSSYGINGQFIYARKDATHRYFKYDIVGNIIHPLSQNLYPDGTAILGDKLFIKNYLESGVVKLSWLYSIRNSGIEMHRLLLF